MSRRGSTGPGHPSPLPSTTYIPPPAVRGGDEHTLTVAFDGEDGRRKVFRIDELPLPGWHLALAGAMAARIGPAGAVRTLATALHCWDSLQRFVRFLAQLAGPPQEPGNLLRGHVDRFVAARAAALSESRLASELRSIAGTLRQPPLAEQLSAHAVEPLVRRRVNLPSPGKPGYTDHELAELITAARADVAALRDRLEHGEALLDTGQAPPVAPDVGLDPGWFAAMAATGVVPRDPRRAHQLSRMRQRREWASHLFLTWPDVTSLLVLLVALTGRNVETIKELPAEHRILDGRAVELRLIKRRRGRGAWQKTVTWEIGPPHRALHTPGGLYLLLHRLTARGRRHTGSSRIWSIWRNGDYVDKHGADEHLDPFAATLNSHSEYLRDWTAAHPAAGSESERGLRIDFIRLKTSIDVRRARQMGGHLPSAARSNTYPVLFTNYLRDDPTTIDWSRDVLDDALVDAEHAALDAHRRALATSGGQDRLTTQPASASGLLTDADADGDGEEAGWNRCVDPERHPVTGTACRASLLDCFHCGNATITPAHLPRLLDLLDALDQRRAQLPETDWWSRYGSTWAAIRHDVIPAFSPAELDRAATEKTGDALLDLVENPWEHP